MQAFLTKKTEQPWLSKQSQNCKWLYIIHMQIFWICWKCWQQQDLYKIKKAASQTISVVVECSVLDSHITESCISEDRSMCSLKHWSSPFFLRVMAENMKEVLRKTHQQSWGAVWINLKVYERQKAQTSAYQNDSCVASATFPVSPKEVTHTSEKRVYIAVFYSSYHKGTHFKQCLDGPRKL